MFCQHELVSVNKFYRNMQMRRKVKYLALLKSLEDNQPFVPPKKSVKEQDSVRVIANNHQPACHFQKAKLEVLLFFYVHLVPKVLYEL